ncbi:hypothetical protein BpHYR1_046581 [Brachionus plicatilis]|uniref:Uncharacterized protein n=1 Tax=Brachionus plicatilis TaxID=10195 RepID=A0A3M7RNG0_BRAPC|nr:hypothetical protein BpHYR1_046581 [Brachionus plicatilis]
MCRPNLTLLVRGLCRALHSNAPPPFLFFITKMSQINSILIIGFLPFLIKFFIKIICEEIFCLKPMAFISIQKNVPFMAIAVLMKTI